MEKEITYSFIFTSMTSANINDLVKNEIIEKTIDLTTDYFELGLDAFLDENLLKEIPLVKSLVTFYNIASSVKDRHNVKKILTFFQEFHKQTIDPEKYKEFLHKFISHQSYNKKVVETIILLNERFLEIEKSKVLANLTRAHIEGNLSWAEFENIYVVLDSIHTVGFLFLKKMAELGWHSHQLRDEKNEPLMLACGI